MPRKSGIKGAILGRSTAQRYKNRIRWRIYKSNLKKREAAIATLSRSDNAVQVHTEGGQVGLRNGGNG